MTEEEFRLYKENLCVMLELWGEYEEKIEKYSALTMQERIDRYEFGANPITEFIFLSQCPEFTKAERIAFMEEIQEHGLLSNQAYERIVGEAPNKDATAMIELTYRASLTRMTFDEMIQQDAREQSARLNQFIGGVLLMNLMDINAAYQNPAPYDGNLNPIYRLDQMELYSKNGFKNYAYMPLSRETIEWLREHDTSLNLVIEGVGKGAGEAEFGNTEKLVSHFEKHGKEFGGVYQNAEEYLQGANDLIKNGIKVEYVYKGEVRTGYVKFMKNSSLTNKSGVPINSYSKFEFVGTNNLGEITTYHVESGKSFWKMLNGENIPIINPVE